MNSSLYFGDVSHERMGPKRHFFRYRLFMVHLFLDELDQVFKERLFWSARRANLAFFKRSDYHGDKGQPLEKAVRETMARQLGKTPEGRISILTHLRYFGHCFNPVTFYYCWDKELEKPVAFMTEITNTPWDERHAQAFAWDGDENPGNPSMHAFRKEFHVSPFIGMDVDYEWSFNIPANDLRVQMLNREKGEVTFRAEMNLQKKPISTWNLAFALLRFPFLTVQVLAGIYWHALLLRFKGCQHHPHPNKDPATDMTCHE